MSVREVPLTRGYVALVDEADYDMVAGVGKWQALTSSNTTYAYHNTKVGGRQVSVLMHRLLVPDASGPVDHRDGDGLNNSRSNLRAASNSENGGNAQLGANNRSGFKGVSWHKRRRKWLASIKVDRRSRFLGYHLTPEEAALAYDVAAREAWGEFACLNFPEPGERGARSA